VLQAIVAELRERFGCHLILLYGSHARGDAGPASDFDVLGIRDQGPDVVREARWEQGAYWDLFIDSASYIHDHPQDLLHVADGRVLYDERLQGEALLQRLRELQRAPVEPLRSDETSARRVWAGKMVARARLGDAEGNYRRHWLLYALLEDYFALRTLRYRGPKGSLQWLRENQPEVFDLFAQALAPEATFEDIEALQKAVVN
jgi:predicted nucleotidyltransferase